MLGLLASVLAGIGAWYGHVKSRRFVRRRLRYTRVMDVPWPFLGFGVGVATTIIMGPVVGFLPLFGGGTALLMGLGVGSGVALGARDVRVGLIED